MPRRGDTVYRVWDGKLETARFIKEEIQPGCSLPIHRVRRPKELRDTTCSTDHFLDTELKAWERYLRECKEALPSIQRHLQAQVDRLELVIAEIAKTEGAIQKLKE